MLQTVRSHEYLESTLSLPIRAKNVHCSWVACCDLSCGPADYYAVKCTAAIVVYSLKECMRARQDIESISADICLRNMEISAALMRMGPDLYH